MLLAGTDEKWLLKVFRGKLSVAMGVRQEKSKMHEMPFKTGKPG